MTILDLRAATPVEIDTVLADLDYKRYVAFMRAVQYRQSGYKAQEGSRYSRPDPAYADKLFGLAAEEDIKVAELEKEMAPYEAEFTRRGGWTRAFLVVTSGQGHVHSSQRCHTCYPTTQFHWVTGYSGHDEDEIVGDAGERACTICYPSAPVDVLARPTKILSKDEEERLAARAEREAKRAAKAALEVIDPDTGKTLFKTERGATNEIASRLDAYFSYDSQEYLDKAAKIVKAVAFKRGVKPEDLLAELKGKAEKKFRREAVKQIKYMLKTKGFPGWQDKSDPALWYDSYRRVAKEEGLI
jgi:hypothetical protein